MRPIAWPTASAGAAAASTAICGRRARRMTTRPAARRRRSRRTSSCRRATQQAEQRLLAEVFGRPEQLRAEQAADDAGEPRRRPRRAARPPRLAAEQPDADQRAERDHDAEAGDLEIADAEEDGIDGGLLGLGRGQSASRRSRSALAITDTELNVIAALAIIGLSSQPKNGYSTPAAIGTPSTL